MTTRTLLTAGMVLMTAANLDAAAGKATGYFRLDKTRSTFTSACAFRLPDPSGKSPGITHVLLADKALDCDAADRTFDPVEAAKQQVAAQKPAFVTFTLPAGDAVDRIDGGWNSTDPEDGFSFEAPLWGLRAVSSRSVASRRFRLPNIRPVTDRMATGRCRSTSGISRGALDHAGAVGCRVSPPSR